MLARVLDAWRRRRGYESTGVRAGLHRIDNALKMSLARVRRPPIVPYVTTAPDVQRTLDLFKGEWISQLPPSLGQYQAGPLPFFDDARLKWGLEQLGGVEGLNVLELGPLDGGHTFVLEQMGAASITAVEANPKSFLRCLVYKELLGLTRARVLLGDCAAYLREQPALRFDLCVASGILYHLEEPIELLARIAPACPRIYLWTHYFDPIQIARRPDVQARFGPPEPRTRHGFAHTAYPYRYQTERFLAHFSGGAAKAAHWLDRDHLLGALRHFGYTDIRVGLEDPIDIHGPSIAIAAQRLSPRAAPPRAQRGE